MPVAPITRQIYYANWLDSQLKSLPSRLQREVAKKYQKMSFEEIADKLSDIKEIPLFYPDTMKPVRKLSNRNDIQERLYQILNLGDFAPKEIG